MFFNINRGSVRPKKPKYDHPDSDALKKLATVLLEFKKGNN